MRVQILLKEKEYDEIQKALLCGNKTKMFRLMADTMEKIYNTDRNKFYSIFMEHYQSEIVRRKKPEIIHDQNCSCKKCKTKNK